MHQFTSDISRLVWENRYRWRDGDSVHDQTIEDTWKRVAEALAAPEADAVRSSWARSFYHLLENFRFVPGGRIQAGAGTARQVTLFNCFVMGRIEDSMDGIFDALKEAAVTMQQGGGVGFDFSTLRPAGSSAARTGRVASGPVSFMRIWDAMCATVLSMGYRRGAMMATLRCDHPDIERFVTAKETPGELTHFNVSVLASDEFMEAVRNGDTWPLVFPLSEAERAAEVEGEVIERRWSGAKKPVPCQVYRRIDARALWDEIIKHTYDHGEPGVIFIDRVNQDNNLYYREDITATNPCGEIPLPPYGACNLGSFNLTRFVQDPFTSRAALDFAGLGEYVEQAVRLLDNVIDVSQFPLDAQAEKARGTRRIGLGITGLGDALAMLGIRYDSDEARKVGRQSMERICHEAYRASIRLAAEKGPFPFFEKDAYLKSRFASRLPRDIREGIAASGIRNSHVTAIAPTGTISVLADNVSSGIEPIYGLSYSRRMRDSNGEFRQFDIKDYAYANWQSYAQKGTKPPEAFVTALEIEPHEHLKMQAALQPFVDNSISKTINIPPEYPFESFRDVYDKAYDMGAKGCTTFRSNVVSGAILEASGKTGTGGPPSG